MKKILLSATLLISVAATAQDSTNNTSNPFSFSSYIESYYTYDFSKPADNNRPGFIYSHNRHNEFNLNLGFVRGSYTTDKVRGNLAIATGTYMNANYAAEPGVLKNIYEANAGFKIGKKNLWLDAGIFPSHIGYESAISKDNWTLTRSIAAENSPYYEAGAKITYTSKNDKVLLSGMVLNGWQRIQRPEANNTPAVGTQVNFKPNSKTTINWSTFIGNDKPDSIKQWRYFNNFYGIFQFNEKFGLTLGFDIGQEQISKRSSKLNAWYSPTIVVRFTPGNNWAIAARGEYYSDENGVIVSTGTTNGFKTLGVSLNVDRRINDNFWWRIELRTLNSKDSIFKEQGLSTKNNTAITTSLAISF